MENGSQNQSVNPAETPAQPAQHPINNQRGNFPILLGVIMFLVVIAGGVYYLGTQNKTSNTTPTASTPTESVSPSPVSNTGTGTKMNKGTVTVDEASNEKIYTSSVVNFSIRVPKDWEIDDKQGVFISSPGEVVFAPPGTDTYSPFSQKIAVTTSEKGSPRFPYGTESDFKQKLAEPTSTGTGQRLYKIGNIKVDGKDAMQYVSRTLPGDPTETFYAVVTWVQHNGLNYYFEFEPDEKETKDNLPTYNKIISTVTFTN